MENRSAEVRAALIRSGREEMLAKGFEKSSLRVICQRAGVTTGAFYFYFQKKSDLFRAIIGDTVDALRQVLAEARDSCEDEHYDSSTLENKIIELMITRREELQLLLEGSQGTEYASFKENLLRGLHENACETLSRQLGRPVDQELVRVIVGMKLQGYLEILFGGYPEKKIRALSRSLAAFSQGGASALLQGE